MGRTIILTDDQVHELRQPELLAAYRSLRGLSFSELLLVTLFYLRVEDTEAWDGGLSEESC